MSALTKLNTPVKLHEVVRAYRKRSKGTNRFILQTSLHKSCCFGDAPTQTSSHRKSLRSLRLLIIPAPNTSTIHLSVVLRLWLIGVDSLIFAEMIDVLMEDESLQVPH